MLDSEAGMLEFLLGVLSPLLSLSLVWIGSLTKGRHPIYQDGSWVVREARNGEGQHAFGEYVIVEHCCLRL